MKLRDASLQVYEKNSFTNFLLCTLFFYYNKLHKINEAEIGEKKQIKNILRLRNKKTINK